ncbi:hypothetical protein RhiJN_00314 [Ceratobasidium sp. AG-Ba]|nr:hypothetical protein RhiJN_00314 [Ceratobasidium sp. AG-Ba]
MQRSSTVVYSAQEAKQPLIAYASLIFLCSPLIILIGVPVLALILVVLCGRATIAAAYLLCHTCMACGRFLVVAVILVGYSTASIASIVYTAYKLAHKWFSVAYNMLKRVLRRTIRCRGDCLSPGSFALAVPLSRIPQAPAPERLAFSAFASCTFFAVVTSVTGAERSSVYWVSWPLVIGTTLLTCSRWWPLEAVIRIGRQCLAVIVVHMILVANLVLYLSSYGVDPSEPHTRSSETPVEPAEPTKAIPEPKAEPKLHMKTKKIEKPLITNTKIVSETTIVAPMLRKRRKIRYGNHTPAAKMSPALAVSKWASASKLNTYGFMMPHERGARTYSHCFVQDKFVLTIEWYEEKVRGVTERTRAPYSMIGGAVLNRKALLLLLPAPTKPSAALRPSEPSHAELPDNALHQGRENLEVYVSGLSKHNRDTEPECEASKRQRHHTLGNTPPFKNLAECAPNAPPRKRVLSGGLLAACKRQRLLSTTATLDHNPAPGYLEPTHPLPASSARSQPTASLVCSTIPLKRLSDDPLRQTPSKRLCNILTRPTFTQRGLEASETSQTTCGFPKELDPANSTTSSCIVVEIGQSGVTLLDALDSPSEPDRMAAFAPSADSRLVSPMDHGPASGVGSAARPFLTSSLLGMRPLGSSTRLGHGLGLGVQGVSVLETHRPASETGLTGGNMVIDEQQDGSQEMETSPFVGEMEHNSESPNHNAEGMDVDQPRSGYGAYDEDRDVMDTRSSVANHDAVVDDQTMDDQPMGDETMDDETMDGETMDDEPLTGSLDHQPSAAHPEPESWGPSTSPPASRWGSPPGSPDLQPRGAPRQPWGEPQHSWGEPEQPRAGPDAAEPESQGWGPSTPPVSRWGSPPGSPNLQTWGQTQHSLEEPWGEPQQPQGQSWANYTQQSSAPGSPAQVALQPHFSHQPLEQEQDATPMYDNESETEAGALEDEEVSQQGTVDLWQEVFGSDNED